MRYLWVIGLVAGLGLAGCGPEPTQPPPTPVEEALPIIIAHRGASGELPEHTLEAYRRAIVQGADFIEPDLVMTKDGVLVARHDLYLSTSTDVAMRPQFADRKRTRQTLYGTRTDWWAEDFTLAEIKTLRARQPFPGRSRAFDGRYEIPTFTEVLNLVTASAAAGRVVGVYPETKSPGHHAEIDLDMVTPLLDALETAELARWGVPIFIQSFEPAILSDLKARRTKWPLIQLLSGDVRAIAAGFEPPLERLDVAGIGVNKALLWTDVDTPTDLVARAKAQGLLIHVWTVRDDRVGPGFAHVEDELNALFDLGVDGVFTDFPETALGVRDGAE